MPKHLPEGPVEMLAALEAASILCGPSPQEILSKTREARVVKARHLAMCALYNTGQYSTGVIGRFFNRDHSTVVHSVRAVRWRIGQEPRTAELLAKIVAEIQSVPSTELPAPSLHYPGYRGVEHVPVYVLPVSPVLKNWLNQHASEIKQGWLLDLNLVAVRLLPRELLALARSEGGRHRYLMLRERK